MAATAIHSLLKASSQNLPVGVVTKTPLLDRYHYSGPSGYHHEYSHKGGGSKNRVALSALTLLAFLFFLNILQNCIQDHIDDLQGNQVLLVSARDDIVEADKREDDLDNLANITTSTTTSSPMPDDPDDYDPDMYFEEIPHVTSGPSKIYIKKHNSHSHFH